MGVPRFPGLDTLRFLAAMAVVIGHIPLNQQSAGLPSSSPGALFFRGAPAVSFFFTLSGFLITFLLLEERQETGTIAIKRFYLRRVLRIWPLYFAVVVFGLYFYNSLLPSLGRRYEVHYELATAVLLYTIFLPNLMNSLYTVGGILNPLWSIGIEEQFYLVWAPLVARVRRHLRTVCWSVAASFFSLHVANEYHLFGATGWTPKFVGQLEFHYMAIGGLWGHAVQTRRESTLTKPWFASRILQWALALALVEYYAVDVIPKGPIVTELLQMALYGWLIVNVGVNPRNALRLASRPTEYLGTISYGLYMLHMPMVYVASWTFLSTTWWHGRHLLFYMSYYTLAIGLTVVAAAASYHLFEQRFLRLKDRFEPALGRGAREPGGAEPSATPPHGGADSATTAP